MGFYFVATGWIFEIGLCVNSINQSNQSINQSIKWKMVNHDMLNFHRLDLYGVLQHVHVYISVLNRTCRCSNMYAIVV